MEIETGSGTETAAAAETVALDTVMVGMVEMEVGMEVLWTDMDNYPMAAKVATAEAMLVALNLLLLQNRPSFPFFCGSCCGLWVVGCGYWVVRMFGNLMTRLFFVPHHQKNKDERRKKAFRMPLPYTTYGSSCSGYNRIISFDVGQQYLAGIVLRRELNVPATISTEDRDAPNGDLTGPKIFIGRVVQCKYTFHVEDWRIYELTNGSAPHQPLYPCVDVTRVTEDEHVQIADALNGGIKTSHTAMKKKKRQCKQRRLESLDASCPGDEPATAAAAGTGAGTVSAVHLTEERTAELVGMLVRDLCDGRNGMIECVLIEHQLSEARRNALVESCIISSCNALNVRCHTIMPAVKFQLQSTVLQQVMADTMRRRNGSDSNDSPKLKLAATAIMNVLLNRNDSDATAAEPAQSIVDFKRFDVASFRTHYDTSVARTNPWYTKDLMDTALQAIVMINRLYPD